MAEDELPEGLDSVDSEMGGGDEPSGKNPLLSLILILNVIVVGVVAYFQYQLLQKEATKPDLTSLMRENQALDNPDLADEQPFNDEIKKENLFELETFTVNLASGDGPRRFVRLNSVLKLSDNTQFSEIEARKPQIRDTIINILNSKRPEDLLRREGKYNLKNEIKASINSFLIDGEVLDIFYVGFQIN